MTTASNRTNLELKPVDNAAEAQAQLTSNRTNLELKHALRVEGSGSAGPLIAPIWN